jgi:hypothetical protein
MNTECCSGKLNEEMSLLVPIVGSETYVGVSGFKILSST